MYDPWLPGGRPDPHAEFRLFCIPHLGGNSALYLRWRQYAGPAVHVCPVELPGRGRRLADPPFTRMPALVAALADALDAQLDRPFALFGHSLGGLIAFELARTLRERGRPQPARLFIAAMAAPGSVVPRPFVHDTPDEEVIEELRALGGTPPELLANEELMELMLPTLRADFTVLETYRCLDGPALDTPISAFGGTEDTAATAPALRAWSRYTTKTVRLRMFRGGHFFPAVEAAGLMQEIRRDLPASAAGRVAGASR
ncbi:thioesterase [Actinocrinis puniceicyclus]|uniref:Thioesterase n=1 Tax=Actinocrinis puniceicyclus TaxID=977794 RepID=A0A8J7WIR5_9ACTN|nr:alpha/beta fold hydrolase [Actinocrinis puniceicyclus]MBS2962966.1 thioesterase [Actinocrinis puniceicyclus]